MGQLSLAGLLLPCRFALHYKPPIRLVGPG